MAACNMNTWRSNLMACDQRCALPIMTHPGIELIGKKVLDAVTSGEVHYQAIKALDRLYPAAGCTMMMDLTVEAEAFGCPVTFSDHEVPTVAGRLVHDRRSVTDLKVPSLTTGRIPEYLKAAKLAATGITDRPVLGGCIGPFSLAGRLFGMTEIMTELFLEPGAIRILVEKCAAFVLDYAHEMKKCGLNGIIMAEPAAGLLDESLCDSFSSAFIRDIVAALQDDHFLIILHNCGNTGHVTQSMIRTGAMGLHVGNRINLVQALHEIPGHILVFGNLDPVGAFKMASLADMKRLTMQLLNSVKGHKNFVLSSGCDTPPGIPHENIHAFYEALHEFNNHPVVL